MREVQKLIADSIVHVTAGPAAESLAQVATAIVTLQALLEGQGALLGNAPEDIKQLCSEAVEASRKLADKLADAIGKVKPPSPPEEDAGDEKEDVDIPKQQKKQKQQLVKPKSK